MVEVMKMITETEIQTRGLVDAADRILRELLRTPKFKEAIMILLNSIDPPAARRLVRTFFWQDPGLLMSIIGSLPSLINLGSEALAEVADQLSSMPPPLVQDLFFQVITGIDGAVAGEAAGGLVAMGLSLGLDGKGSRLKKSLSSLGDDFGRAYSGVVGDATLTGRLEGWMAGMAEKARDKDSGTYSFIQAAGKAMQDNPDFVEYVLKPLLAPALKAPSKTSKAQAKKPSKAKPAKDK
jgi:hypothetical protein